MVQRNNIRTVMPDGWVQQQRGKYVDQRHYDTIIRGEAADVYKPDGSPLLLYRPGILAPQVCNAAKPALRRAGGKYSDHRGWHTGIIGYFDVPECRKTHFTGTQISDWGKCLTFIRACASVFQIELPSRYNVQRNLALSTDPRWVIADTAFTTVTVNLWDQRHDARTALHVDAGDLPEGFGVLAVLSSGSYDGGYLVLPKYRIAVDLRTTDMLLYDVHEYHGNAPLVGKPGWERIACILYYRTAMQHCAQGE